jgi:hypothetical protein
MYLRAESSSDAIRVRIHLLKCRQPDSSRVSQMTDLQQHRAAGEQRLHLRAEGVTYNGEGGAVETFSIPAGTYSLNQQASYDPANDPDGTGECLFGGELDYLSGSGGTIPLGNGGVPIPAQVPIDGPPSTAPYPAGDYRLYIYPSTTCSWTVELGPDN